MRIYSADTKSNHIDLLWLHLVECTLGCLLAALLYLYVCVGPGIIPWQVANYFVYLGAIGVCMSATSHAKDQHWTWRSLISPAILAPFYLLFFLGFGFLAGLPGTEWTTRQAVQGFFLFPLIAITIQIARRPQSIAIISLASLIALLVGGIGIHLLSANAIQKEIASTLANGGCVFSTGEYDFKQPEAISSIDDVKIGIISTESDRIYFINGPTVKSWSYSRIEPVSRDYFDKVMVSDCDNRKGGISATP